MTWSNTSRDRLPTRRAALLLGAGAVAGIASACTKGDDGPLGDGRESGAAALRDEVAWPVVVEGTDAEAAIAASAALLSASSAAVVVAPGADAEVVRDATEAAVTAGVPCFVDDPALGGELERLGVEDVRLFAADPDATTWSEGVASLEAADTLPEDPREHSGELVVATADEAAYPAATATIRAVIGAGGMTVIPSDDPRDDAVLEALGKDEGTRLAVVGGTDRLAGDALAGAAAMAVHAEQLPTGGLLPLAGERRMIALYGHPGVPGLGLLGEQDVEASVERVEDLVEDYADVAEGEFLPAFEIIATIADSSAGDDGDYSTEGDPELYRPWVDAAKEAGVYVLLDLQPGRTDFLTQAKLYEELLTEPHVGLALDPEWRLEPDQVHMRQIGHVEIEEVNETAAWLAELTREHKLPQKIFMLHQFQLQMLRDRDQLRTDLPEIVTVVHADGHGTPDLKQGTWEGIKRDLPDGVELGWKNFIDEDTPTFTPERTMTEVEPAPRFVSYQ